MKRNIIKIDEDKCNGCGECVVDCAEGALQIIDGKARLVKESLCDGLGACIGHCPTGALTIEERVADSFDEKEVEKHLSALQGKIPQAHAHHHQHPPSGCPGQMAKQWDAPSKATFASTPTSAPVSALRQWPIELKLVNPSAPCFKNAHLLIAADCVAFSFGNFHQRFLEGKSLVIFCPKLDQSTQEYIDKLSLIFMYNDIQSLTVVHMEVPCCSGTTHIVQEALKRSGKQIIIKDYTISLQGEII